MQSQAHWCRCRYLCRCLSRLRRGADVQRIKGGADVQGSAEVQIKKFLNKFTSTTWLEDRGSFKLPRFTPQQGRRSSRIPGTEYPFVVVDNGNRMRLHPQYRSRDGIPNTWANLVFVGDPTPSGLSSLLVRCHCGYHVAPSCIARGQVWRLVENKTYPSSPDVSIPELERCQRCSI